MSKIRWHKAYLKSKAKVKTTGSDTWASWAHYNPGRVTSQDIPVLVTAHTKSCLY